MKKYSNLKKIFFLLFVAAFLSENVVAQDVSNQDKGFRWSCNAGVLYSNTLGKTDNSLNEDYILHSSEKCFLPGYRVGTGVIFDFNKTLSLDIALNYEQKNHRIKETGNLHLFPGMIPDPQVSTNQKLHYHYITLPVRLEVRYHMFYVSPGLYAGALVFSSDKGTLTIEGLNSRSIDQRIKDNEQMDFGALIGVGVNIPLCVNHTLQIGVGGAWSLTGINMAKAGNILFKSQNYSLDVKYSFKIK
jgi:hypothetical protein